MDGVNSIRQAAAQRLRSTNISAHLHFLIPRYRNNCKKYNPAFSYIQIGGAGIVRKYGSLLPHIGFRPCYIRPLNTKTAAKIPIKSSPAAFAAIRDYR